MKRQSESRTHDARVRSRMLGGPPLLALLCVLTVCRSLPGSAAPRYVLDWDSTAGGGGASTADSYTLVDTLGQPDAGVALSEALRWEAGFPPGLNLQPEGTPSSWVTDEDTLLSGRLTASDLEGDLLTFTLDTPPTNGAVTLLADGAFTYHPTKDYNGGDSFTFKVNDGEFDSVPVTASLAVTPVNDAPTVAASPEVQAVQYSDPIADLTIQAQDIDSPGFSLSVTTFWQKDGGCFKPGLPADMALALDATGTGNRIWMLSGLAQVPPGMYLIRIVVTDDQAAKGTTDVIIEVTPEDARGNYTGALFASTASASSSIASVTLSATIQDITAVLGDPAYDDTEGDIRNATVAFINRDNNTVIAEDVPIGLVSLSDTTTGTATYNWTVNIGSADSASFTIGIVVNGCYTRNASEDDTVVTVTKPLTSDFITGGGYLLLCRSAGLCAGSPGTKANFGFNVKYNKSGKNLQGHLNVIVRSAGRVYQAKGNVMSSLSISGSQATFNGKASIMDITNPLLPISIDGNATLQVVMTDAGDLGTSDTIAITVWNKNGGLWFASNWNGTNTEEQMLGGGNLVVNSARKLIKTTLSATELTTDEPLRLSIERAQDSPSTVASPSFVLRFPVVSRTDYAIERSTDLVNWTHLTKVMSFTDAVEYFDEADSAAGCQFYRVRAIDRDLGLFSDLKSQ